MKTIVWDVDDVLNDLMREWLAHGWKPGLPACALEYAQLVQNPPHALLGVSLDAYRASLDGFRLSARGQDLAPRPEIRAWFEAHGARARHVALTATPLLAAPNVARWVLGHFGRWIQSFAFVPSPRAGDGASRVDATKADYLRWLGRADVFVDDDPQNIAAAGALGILCLTMPRPWNAAAGDSSGLLAQLTKLVTSA